MRQLLSLLLFVSSLTWADTTPNLVGTTVYTAPAGTQFQWSGFAITNSTGGGLSGGEVPGYNTSTGQFMFGYTQGIIAYTLAINSALSGTGVQIGGMEYGLSYYNQGDYRGTLSVNAAILSNTGAVLQSYNHSLPQTTAGWTQWAQSQTFANPHLVSNLSNATLTFTGQDDRFWAGYYGPQFKDPYLRFTYSVDQCVVDPQSSPTCVGYRTYYNMTDDGYAIVNLPFTFPFYGRTFTTSVMYTNGVVGFLDPNPSGYCCNGTDLNEQRFIPNSPWNWAIYALNTDLYPGEQSRFYTQQTDAGTGIKYTWENVLELGTSNTNTFSVNIKDSGYIGINYQQVTLDAYRQPLIGIAGDISAGQYYQKYYGPASAMTATAGTAYTFTGTETTDVCAANPLINTQCPGYAEAYYNQQCSLNPLYATTCPGYETAYYNQQCSINPLYAVTCSGYEAAYLNQQCSLNPLYSASCTGYQAASEACSANPLTANYCPGYQTATAECGVNSLLYTYCPNYQTALAACSTDAQSNTLCPGYSTTTASADTSSAVATTVSTTEPSVSVKDDGTVSTEVAIVADSAVNSVLTKNTETTTAVETATATEPVVLASASTSTATTTTVSAPTATEQKATTAAVESVVASVEVKETKDADTKTDAKKEDGKSEEKTSSSNSKSDTKSKAAARREAVKKAATEKAKELANDMSRAATLEAQTASQATVLGLMNYTPGFDSYNNAIVPDINARAMARQYNKDNVDNRNVMRRLNGASERLHQEMVDQQYQLRR